MKIRLALGDKLKIYAINQNTSQLSNEEIAELIKLYQWSDMF